ncbi:MAG: putative metal-dependent phosphoesterase TrpH [Candidatus Azotimanducaceae bacterium]|jgi:predicted metal-dependent phosphoesterase TrpH
MKADLHCHSYYSDGTQSPDFLIQRAIENQVTHLAITDHDCTAALDDVFGRDALGSLPEISVIGGVEISCGWESLEIHVVGLFVDHKNVDLQTLLTSQQLARRQRVLAMHEKLEALGTFGLFESLESMPCIAYTRSHVAHFLVSQGVCKTHPKAFKSHLGKRGKIYVASNWCSLVEAIAGIKAAGGIAVLAHPGRYPLNKKKLEALVLAFKAAGGEALEGSYRNIDPKDTQHLGRLAVEHGLYLSAGSDFHDPAARWTDIGRFPALEQAVQEHAIWQHPIWRDHYCSAL